MSVIIIISLISVNEPLMKHFCDVLSLSVAGTCHDCGALPPVTALGAWSLHPVPGDAISMH